MMKLTKEHWVNILVVLVTTILSLVVVEVVLQMTNKGRTIDDPYLGVRMRPNSEWDENGFRNPAVLESAQIVAIGDSQTHGNNAEYYEAWPYVLADKMNKSVYSMAVGGYSSVQHAYLVEEALMMDPEVVLIGWYLGNDLNDAEAVTYELNIWSPLRDPLYSKEETTTDDLSKDYRTILGSGVEPGSLKHKVLKIRQKIRTNSRLYALLGNATRKFREQIGVANTKEEKQDLIREVADNNPDIAYVFDEVPTLETVLSPAYRLDTVDLNFKQAAEGWRITKERYKAVKQMLDGAEIPFALVIIPTKEKVYLEYMKQQDIPIPESFTDYNKAETKMLSLIDSYCADEEIRCVSILPAMVAAMQNNTAVYGKSMDGHPKPAGYAVIADAIQAYLTQEKLIQ